MVHVRGKRTLVHYMDVETEVGDGETTSTRITVPVSHEIFWLGHWADAAHADDYAQDYPEPEAIVSAVVAGYSVKEAPVVMRERTGGVSSIRAFKSVYYMIKVSLAIILCRVIHGRKKNDV